MARVYQLFHQLFFHLTAVLRLSFRSDFFTCPHAIYIVLDGIIIIFLLDLKHLLLRWMLLLTATLSDQALSNQFCRSGFLMPL